MSEARLPTHIEVSGLVRRVNAAGGFAVVMAKGEADSGTIMVITSCNGMNFQAFERMPQASGERLWDQVRCDVDGKSDQWRDWLERRRSQDSDLWIVELDIAEPERFIGLSPSAG
ncbi:MAG: DUF1491 family protein [Novosphingobium sp.]